MIEVRTLSFGLRLELNNQQKENCLGLCYFVLFCESAFDANKSFSEEFLSDNELIPFYTFGDAARFAEEMATYWKMQRIINPKLDITRLEEFNDLWQNIALKLNPVAEEPQVNRLRYTVGKTGMPGSATRPVSLGI